MAKCADCGTDFPYLQRAHIIARHKGGSNEPDNIVLICPNCHHLRDRGERVEWMKRAWTPERREKQRRLMAENRATGLTVAPSQMSAETRELLKASWTPERRERQRKMMVENRANGVTTPPTSSAKEMRANADTNSPHAQEKRAESMKTAWAERDWSARNEKVAIAMKGNTNGLGNKGRSKGERWAMLFDSCAVCGSTRSPHKARGSCNACYMKRR